MMTKEMSGLSLERLRWSLAELEGILSGIAADGIIVGEEARYLEFWIELHEEYHAFYPFSLFLTLIKEVLKDGVITESESAEMISLIRSWQSARHTAAPQNIWRETMVFLRDVPVDARLDHGQQVWFRKIIPLLYEVPEESACTLLKLLSRVLEDYIITAEERQELIDYWEALGRAEGWNRNNNGEQDESV